MISVSPSWTWFLKDTDDCWNVTWISQCCTRDVSPVCPPFDKAEWKCSSVAGGCTCSVAPAFRLCSTSASLKMTSFVSSEVDICFSCCCNFHVTPKKLDSRRVSSSVVLWLPSLLQLALWAFCSAWNLFSACSTFFLKPCLLKCLGNR